MRIAKRAATAAVVTGAATRAHKRNSKPAQPDTAAHADSPDSAPTLEDLAAMHASGVLTDEEFTAAKKKALGI
jgi:hypothetical protein